jgi:hypothetical protein
VSIAVLSYRVKNLITFAQSVASAMIDDASFPSSTPTLATLQADMAAMNTAEAAVLARTKEATAAQRMGQHARGRRHVSGFAGAWSKPEAAQCGQHQRERPSAFARLPCEPVQRLSAFAQPPCNWVERPSVFAQPPWEWVERRCDWVERPSAFVRQLGAFAGTLSLLPQPPWAFVKTLCERVERLCDESQLPCMFAKLLRAPAQTLCT